MAAREIVRPGPTGLITTLTKGLTKEDNETRTFSLYMDDSKGHTLRVVQALAEREARGALPEVDPTPWHALYELLPQKEVVVPYAPAIARLLEAQDLPEDLTRLRRDFGRFLTLVKVVALLHHARREEREGRLVAALEDYALAYHLAARPMARSVHTVSPQALALAVAVREVHEAKVEEAAGKNIPEGSVAVYVKDLARHLRWAKRTVQKWVDQAEAAGLVDVQRDGNRLAIRPVEGAPLEEAAFRLLPEPERLARELGEGEATCTPSPGKRACSFSPKPRARSPQKPRKTPSSTRKTNAHAMRTTAHAPRGTPFWRGKTPCAFGSGFPIARTGRTRTRPGGGGPRAWGARLSHHRPPPPARGRRGGGGAVSPWRKLITLAPALAAKVRAMRPPKLRVVADGRVLYWALALPSEEDLEAHAAWPGQNAPSTRAWLVERLAFLEEAWPEVKEVELLGLWAGNPPRLEPIARARVKRREEVGA